MTGGFDDCSSHNCALAHNLTAITVLSHETGNEVDTCGQEREVSHSNIACVSAHVIYVCI